MVKKNPYTDKELTKYDSGYKKSNNVIALEQKKTDAENAVNNYGDFNYSNQATLDEVMNKILNREEFSYDLNGDALYQQYKDKYIQQGKMAMQDTMGQAAAMTGGYGNSYAATVGNQAYQAQLNNLNDIIPELYQMAYDKYSQEGQDLYNQYGLLSDDRSVQYGLWGDKRNQLISDRDYYGNEANNAYVKDYGEWNDSYNRDFNQYWNETNFGYGQERDSKADARTDAYAMIQAGVMPSDELLAASGLSKADVQKLADAYKNIGAIGGGGGNSTTDISGVSSAITSKLEGQKTDSDRQNYLNGLVADGTITEDQAVELYGQYKNPEVDFKDRTWTQVDDGGINWFWGVDNDAKVKDQYGNVYRLDELVDKLVEQGMSKKEAKEFAKKYN